MGTTDCRGIMWLLWPLVQVKRFFDALYNTILSLLWSELTGRKTVGGLWQISGLFLIFCGLSLALFYLQAYESILFLGFAFIWWVDCHWACWQYFQAPKSRRVSLQITPDFCVYCVTSQSDIPTCQQFKPEQIKAILITYKRIQGGVFQSDLGWLWEVAIQLRDLSCLQMYEVANPAQALQRAGALSARFPGVKVKFASSLGESSYALSLPHPQLVDRYHHRKIPGLNIKPSSHGWQLCTEWTYHSASFIVRQVLGRFGFLLFVLMMTEVMEGFGALLHSSMVVYGDDEATRLLLINAARFMALSPDWPDWVEATIALWLVVIQTLKIVQNRRILITPYWVVYHLNGKPVARIPTDMAGPPLMIESPFPMVLLLGKKQAIAVTDLPSETWLYGVWTRLREGLSLNSSPSAQSDSGKRNSVE